MTAGMACGSCGTGLHQNAKFCDECGARIDVAADPAQYKQVTVLFTDVVRSSDIAAAVDMERLRDIMTQLMDRSKAVLRRFGGTVEYYSDGVIALFGAPAAMEDHAFRACLAALAIQQEANRLAAQVQRQDGVALRLRVGLNSGRVIAGEIGSGSLGYIATGEPVGFAHRIQAAAPAGAVMLSESTARLVEQDVTLGEPEWVRIKGADEPVCARRLIAIGPRDGAAGRAEVSLVGRRWEMAALEAIVERAIGGRGEVVSVVGPPGIGKSRVAREAATAAAGRGVEVYWAFCESHAGDVPFHAVTQLLRHGSPVADVDGLDNQAARARMRAQLPDADPQDLLLLDDLLGIAEPGVPLPDIDPDARRRRLTALVNTAALARIQPALYIIEDAHWIDAVSESMLADLLAVIPRTPSMALITARPEYVGKLTRVPGAQTIALAPLGDSEIVTLIGESLGSDPSVGELASIVAERAAGNPFFAGEMVRELVQRGVLAGERGRYVCSVDVAEVSVPATVQAVIEARIDRLSTAAKKTLTAASVIGVRFEAELLAAMEIDPVYDELLGAELIEQVRFTPSAEYAFCHPLIRAVAYESQLKSDRAQWHRRLADAIEAREPESADQNAALIAEHFEVAGELHPAYGWHMRAAMWATNRDLTAARLSWERAAGIADALPADEPDRAAMRIAPRTMLCATAWRAIQKRQVGFAELRELCSAAGDKVSLAIGMSGLAAEHVYAGRPREGSRLASEQMALLESIGDPDPTIGLAPVGFCCWMDAGEFGELMRRSQIAIDLAGGDPAKGAGFGFGSPLAAALAWRGVARWWLGRPGWRQDVDDALAMVRHSDPTSRAGIVAWTYGLAIQYGVLRADDVAVRATEDAARAAADASNDVALSLGEYTLAVGLLNADDGADRDADRERGLELMSRARETWLRLHVHFLLPVTELWAARETAKRGDRDAAIPVMRTAVDDLRRAGDLGYGVWAAGVLAETLLERGTEADVAEAQGLFDWLANLPADGTDQDWAVRDVTLLRLRALFAGARGDGAAYRDLVSRYRATAESLGFEGHTAWAEAMVEDAQ